VLCELFGRFVILIGRHRRTITPFAATCPA
jgi:hypothetical protein